MFDFISLPDGFEGASNGEITAYSKNIKTVTIIGKAFDANDESVNFSFEVEFIPVADIEPNRETKESSSGGTIWLMNLALLLFLLIKVKTNLLLNRCSAFTNDISPFLK